MNHRARAGGAIVLVAARSLADLIELPLHFSSWSLHRCWHEDYFRVGLFGHLLHRLKVSDLHSGRRRQNIRSLAHKLRTLHLRSRRNDLRLTRPLALSGHGERVLQVLAEDDVLDEHALDLRAPAGGSLFDDFANRLRDFFTAFDHVLQHAGADDVAESGLRALDEGLADVGDAEGGFVGGSDVVVDDGGEGEVDVVCCEESVREHSIVATI